MGKLHEFWFCIRNWRELYSDYNERERISQQRAEALKALGGLGFEWGLGSPAHNVGTALELADEYGIEIHRGTCYGDCVAFIPKERWRYPLNREIKSGRYGTFFEDKNPDEIEEIAAWGLDVPLAVSRCLRNARIAGVV